MLYGVVIWGGGGYVIWGCYMGGGLCYMGLLYGGGGVMLYGVVIRGGLMEAEWLDVLGALVIIKCKILLNVRFIRCYIMKFVIVIVILVNSCLFCC